MKADVLHVQFNNMTPRGLPEEEAGENVVLPLWVCRDEAGGDQGRPWHFIPEPYPSTHQPHLIPSHLSPG